MTVSTTTSKVSYAGNDSTVAFAVNFYFLANSHLKVVLRASDGTETVQALNTDYTVAGAGVSSGGTVTMNTAPATGQTLVIARNVPQTQLVDYQPNDPFPANTHEQALDQLTMEVQQLQEAINRSIKLSLTNTMNSTEFSIGAAARANKIFAFDANGEFSITQELGTYRGGWSSGVAYAGRDIIKDTSNNNIYICVTAHTSSGSLPISSNTDSAKWQLLVDAATVASDAAAAAASATLANDWATKTSGAVAGGEYSAKYHAQAASASAGTATTQASAASTSASNANTAKLAAQSAQSAAETARDQTLAVYDSFDDRYLGSKTSDPSVDNDGNPLVAGTIYFNSVSGVMRLYTGSAWVAAYVQGVASSIGFTPAGGIAATNVQAAIEELDSEKQPLDAATAKTNVVQSFTKSQRGTPVALSSSSNSIATDASLGNYFTHTFTENTTLANPTNLAAGQSGVIVFTQHASSPKTLAFGSYWKFASGSVPSVTASNSAVDVLAYYVESTTRITARLIGDVK